MLSGDGWEQCASAFSEESNCEADLEVSEMICNGFMGRARALKMKVWGGGCGACARVSVAGGAVGEVK